MRVSKADAERHIRSHGRASAAPDEHGADADDLRPVIGLAARPIQAGPKCLISSSYHATIRQPLRV